MTHLSWSEEQAAEELAGALISAAALGEHRPLLAGDVRIAVLAKIGDRERDLIRRLAEEMTP